MSLGILVYGDNHLILRGPRPTASEARGMAAGFGLSVARIAPALDRSGEWGAWRISVREFREDLEWAVRIVAGPDARGTVAAPTAAVEQLLGELAGRGIFVDLIEESACVG